MKVGKVGVLVFFDILWVEVGDVIGIIIVMLGWIESEIIKGKFIYEDGDIWID